jgi:hypothetical protein
MVAALSALMALAAAHTPTRKFLKHTVSHASLLSRPVYMSVLRLVYNVSHACCSSPCVCCGPNSGSTRCPMPAPSPFFFRIDARSSAAHTSPTRLHCQPRACRHARCPHRDADDVDGHGHQCPCSTISLCAVQSQWYVLSFLFLFHLPHAIFPFFYSDGISFAPRASDGTWQRSWPSFRPGWTRNARPHRGLGYREVCSPSSFLALLHHFGTHSPQ